MAAVDAGMSSIEAGTTSVVMAVVLMTLCSFRRPEMPGRNGSLLGPRFVIVEHLWCDTIVVFM